MASTTTVGRYQLRAKLGAGAFGTVYRAYDPNLDREIALKILKSNLLAAPGVRERFQREARAAARLDHPNIVPIYDADTTGGKHCYLASKLIAGQSLDKFIPENGLDPRRAVALLVQLLDALAHAHAQNILHRDVKPANCLVDAQECLYLTDFGLAGSLADENTRLTKEGAVMGTASYMAPEQAKGERDAVGPAADQYSAGVALYELLTGHRPFNGPIQIVIYHAVYTAPPPLSKFRPGLDRTLEMICLTALAKPREERFADCSLFAEALRAWLTRQTPLVAATLPVALPARSPAPTEASASSSDSETVAPGKKAPPSRIGQITKWQPASGKPPRSWLVGAGMLLALVLAVGAVVGCLSLSALLFSPTNKPLDPIVLAQFPRTMDVDLDDGVKLEFVLLNAKGNDTFQMGATKNDLDIDSSEDEKPPHKVTLTNPFYLAKYPVTQEQYVKLMKVENPSYFQVGNGGAAKLLGDVKDTSRFPVEKVSWDEADTFCKTLTDKHGSQTPAVLRGLKYRFALPTEAQWEYACRAGTSNVYYFGNDAKELDEYAWYHAELRQ